MKICSIDTNRDLTAALRRVDVVWGAEPGTPNGDELDSLVDMITAYEDLIYPVPKPQNRRP
ncbi:putative transcription regulator containing HTH domain protein [Cognatishimia activa]|uniref:Putative transcription regulator containing HTH domain protein n=1 Tax=Cognatishimia activa TaxID=1715691 RepID=A0A0P1IQ16_9RHOB|nr:putative transcription regulator containing HTH domain protein [Cognatishimia activa]CUK25549.1 putative transcription regulator containing HTH domain protein [Cognatishimia activa]